ncbi:MAG: hypothetical protein IKN85_15940 [Oscillospiraceae bacterium]|nr:hypothetical protein [Oscillospiraceae bacterium]
MSKNKIAVLVSALIASVVLASCGPVNENTNISTGEVTEKVTEETTAVTVAETEAETEKPETKAVTEAASEAAATVEETKAAEKKAVETAAETVKATAEAPSLSGYKAAYLETCKSLASTDGDGVKFSLVYIDGDDVPELAAGNDGYWVSLFKYADGKVYTVMDHAPYGAMGNAGYDYLPGHNCIHNSNADFAGMIRYETYMKINENHELETFRVIQADYFDDKNGNRDVDEDEMDTYTGDGRFFIGDKEITAEEFAEYQKGDYLFINGAKTLDEIIEVLEN